MSDRAAVLREIDALEALQQALAAIAERTDPQRRHDLTALRRKLATQIGQTREVANPVFDALDPDTSREFRAKLSAMRSAMALHQANWPAVRLDEDPHGYFASALTAREVNRAFIAWVRATLGTA